MNTYKIKKRNHATVAFDFSKIKNAIQKAFNATRGVGQAEIIELLSLRAIADAEQKIRNGCLGVEDIQDSVEKILSDSGYADVAKAYILYRKQREKMRNASATLINYKELVDNYLRVNDWRVKENSTVTYSVGGLILSNSGAITANYWLSEVYDEEIAHWAHLLGKKKVVLLCYESAEKFCHRHLVADWLNDAHPWGDAAERVEEIALSELAATA